MPKLGVWVGGAAVVDFFKSRNEVKLPPAAALANAPVVAVAGVLDSPASSEWNPVSSAGF